MGDQLDTALAQNADPLAQIEAIAETYVRFVLAHKVGFDLIFAPELRGCDDDALRTAGRRVSDLMMVPCIEVSTDMMRALELNEELWTSAHGYGALFVTRFFGLREEPVGRLGTADGSPARSRGGSWRRSSR